MLNTLLESPEEHTHTQFLLSSWYVCSTQNIILADLHYRFDQFIYLSSIYAEISRWKLSKLSLSSRHYVLVSNFSFQLNEGKHGMLLLSEQKSCPLEQFKGTVHPWEKKTKHNNILWFSICSKHGKGRRKGNLAECFRCLFCVCERNR